MPTTGLQRIIVGEVLPARCLTFLMFEVGPWGAMERNAELGIMFHIFEQHFLAAAIIEFRGPTVGMASDSLSGFKGGVIFQKIRDAGGPERVSPTKVRKVPQKSS
jgi:hypothetical protein